MIVGTFGLALSDAVIVCFFLLFFLSLVDKEDDLMIFYLFILSKKLDNLPWKSYLCEVMAS